MRAAFALMILGVLVASALITLVLMLYMLGILGN
jgi:hypothetical protein